MRLFLFLLTVEVYSQSTLASEFINRQSRNNDYKIVATTDATNKKSNSITSHLMRRFCKLHPNFKWCRTNDNPNTTTFPTDTTYSSETTINVNYTTPKKNEVIEINTNSTYSVEFRNETTPTTTIINDWRTRDIESLESTTIKAASEADLNDYDEFTLLPVTDYTDDAVSIPTTPESTTNCEPNNTASTTTKVLYNTTLIDTPASISTGHTHYPNTSIEFPTTDEAVDNVTLIETTTSVLTDYTSSAITSTEFKTTTEVLNDVTLIGTTMAVPTRYTNICHLIFFIIKQIIKYFYNYLKLNDILFY